MFVYLGIILLCSGTDGERVITATDAKPGEFPFVGCIQFYVTTGYAFMTGSIISENWIMTSDTGLWDKTDKNSLTFYYGVIHVKYGDDESKNYPQTKISRVEIVNTNYPVLLETTTRIVVGANVQLGKILHHTPFGFLKHGCVPGFGTDGDAEGNRYLTYGVITCNFYCKDVLDGEFVRNFSDLRYVCPFGEKFTPSWYGDQGGPLLLRDDDNNYVIGGLLYQWKRSYYKSHGIIMAFIRTSEYLKWLKSHVPDLQIVKLNK